MLRVELIVGMLALSLASWAGTALAANIFKWTDKNGVVHFSERPPEGVNAVPVRGNLSTVPFEATAPAAPTPGQAGPEGGQEGAEAPKSIAQQRREERAKRRVEQQSEQGKLDLQCESMRQQLAWVEPSPRVIVQDPDGTTRRLDDDERMKMVNEARAFIEQNCQ